MFCVKIKVGLKRAGFIYVGFYVDFTVGFFFSRKFIYWLKVNTAQVILTTQYSTGFQKQNTAHKD